MKKIFLFLVVSFCFLSFHSSVNATGGITFTVDKTSLKDDELTVTASTSGLNPTDKIYVKGFFYKEPNSFSSDSFGYTQKDGTWVKSGNNTTITDQKQVTIGTWDGILKVKSDYTDADFEGNGSYQFRIGFYLIKGNGDHEDMVSSGTITTISLEAPAATNTPTNTPTRTPTPNPTSTPTSGPTSVPTATRTPTPPKSGTPTGSVTPTETPEPTEELEETETPTPTEIASPAAVLGTTTGTPHMVIALAFVGAGTGILAVMSLISIIRKKRQARAYLVEE